MAPKKSENQSLIRRYALPVVVVLVIAGMYFLIRTVLNEGRKPRRETSFTMVSLPPPPPPPAPVPTPPPVQQEQPQEEKMIEQEPLTEDDLKQEPPPEQPPDLGTGVVGNGPDDGFGLSKSGNGMIGGGGGDSNPRSKWGWYAAEVNSTISDALRKNKRLRTSRMRVTVRVWPDNTGRITKAQLAESTGDSAMDQVITDEVLTGLQLKTPPPSGMPSPIVLRISARRSK